MSLTDYAGGGYVPVGEHDLQIVEHKFINYNSGSKGVEFLCEDCRGRQTKVSFCFHDKILWRLAEFASVCGMGKDLTDKIEPEKQTGFHLFHGQWFTGTLTPKQVNDKTYAELTDWVPRGLSSARAHQAVQRLHEHQHQQKQPPAEPQTSEPVTSKSIPF